MVHEHGFAEAKHLFLARIEDERAAEAAARAAERARPKTFDEQLARIARGEVRVVDRIPLRRPDPSMTLGGVASAAL